MGARFSIIGAQKSGTTALHHYIQQHPMVRHRGKHQKKEVHFFDTHFKKGISWYKSKFPHKKDSNQLVGDKSPYYLYHPLAAQRAFSLYPEMKIIVILRNPVDVVPTLIIIT